MDRCEFVKSANGNRDLTETIKSSFEKLMRLYNTFGDYECLEVVDETTDSNLKMRVTFSDAKDANLINNALNSTTFKVQDKLCSIHAIKLENVLVIEIIEEILSIAN